METVLIPLLVDVPLWAQVREEVLHTIQSLNPSFSGCPALGLAIHLYSLIF